MAIEYIGKLLPDGHISVDPEVRSRIRQGEKLRIKIERMESDEHENAQAGKKPDPATERILARLANAPKLGRINGEMRREEIYEERSDDRF